MGTLLLRAGVEKASARLGQGPPVCVFADEVVERAMKEENDRDKAIRRTIG